MVSSALFCDRSPARRPGKWWQTARCWSGTLQFWEVGGVEAAVSSEEGVGRYDGVGADKEVGDDSLARPTCPPVLQPACAGFPGDVPIDW